MFINKNGRSSPMHVQSGLNALKAAHEGMFQDEPITKREYGNYHKLLFFFLLGKVTASATDML